MLSATRNWKPETRNRPVSLRLPGFPSRAKEVLALIRVPRSAHRHHVDEPAQAIPQLSRSLWHTIIEVTNFRGIALEIEQLESVVVPVENQLESVLIDNHVLLPRRAY